MRKECPIPVLDYDIITMGHGSGGRLTHNLLEDSIHYLFQNKYLDQRHDGVILPAEKEVIFTTDSFVVSPIYFPGGNIGELAVNGTVNDIAMCGGIPKYLSLALILEEGLKMTSLWDILVSIRNAADHAGVAIVTGDTKVVERGKGDHLFINTTGIGYRHPSAHIGLNNIKAGDKIIISGQLANHGAAVMSVREGIEIQSGILSDTRPLHRMTSALLDEFGGDIHLFRDPTRGGVATSLVEVALTTHLGMEIHKKDLPLDEQVASVCELLGLDPLYVANEGIFISIVEDKIAEKVVERLSQMKGGSDAALIGEVTSNHSGEVLLYNEIGGRRSIGMLPGEQLPRIC